MPPIRTEDGIWKPIRADTNGEGREKYKHGEPLVEIYAVRISDTVGKKCGEIHGKSVLAADIVISVFSMLTEKMC